MRDTDNIQIGRREVLAGMSAATLGLSLSAQAKSTATELPWDYTTDVLCVGSGAAACAAAITALDQGAQVMLIEKLPLLGGTTGKSGGVAWIPNHFLLRAKGIEDKKDDCLRYLARYAYPQIYTAEHPMLGLPEPDYRLLEAFYDNGAPMIDKLRAIGVTQFKEFNLWQVNKPAPDYADHLPENKLPSGRCLEPAAGGGASLGGGSLAAQMEEWLRKRGVPILVEHRVTDLVLRDGRVIGAEAMNGDKRVRIRARRGVVFGTGGYAHNTELVGLHQTALCGSCALPGSTGDFIAIAGRAGARMGALHTAWRTQVLLEEALENRAIGLGAFVLPGDSMLLVNKYGRRVVNEKRNYNDRTQAHFVYDPVREEYPNQLMFMVFDERSLDAFGGNFPFPIDRREARFLIQGATLDELAANIDQRVNKLSTKTGGAKLAPDFAAQLRASVQRFDTYARNGVDAEFERGLHAYDRDWHLLFSARREGTKFPPNTAPNITMFPFAKQGPYYAFVLGAGALDTNGGPAIDAQARVLNHNNQPIAGLYGAGNCIASPSRGAYYGAGGTIGLALTFGYIAGQHAAQSESV